VTLTLNPEAVTLDQLRQLWTGAPARLDNASMRRVTDAGYDIAIACAREQGLDLPMVR
jgi:urocanate hydratase